MGAKLLEWPLSNNYEAMWPHKQTVMLQRELSMDAEYFGKILDGMYFSAPDGETVAMIHLFGIKHASDIRKAKVNPRQIVQASKIPESYIAEINKGMKLEKDVTPK